ncbi:MAG TPA: sugar ABC transporter permease [Anaerolineaceae bacterium]|jgi:multiple sugar transport system permease protein|nr:sugar ABC transporter permease [Anaerolineaceae bacterium]
MNYGLKLLGREKIWLWVMLLPTLIGLVFGTVGSLLATLGLSFFDWDLINPPTWAGLSNYEALFTNPDYIEAFTNTLLFSAEYVPAVVIISLLLAVLLNRKIRGVSIFRTIYFLPAVTSAVASALVWNMIYGKDTGLLNAFLELFHLAPVCWLCADNAMTSVVIVNVWGAIGEGMIIFLAGLTAIPRDYYEAASIDGAGTVKQFFHVTLPLITPSIFFQTLITAINAFQAYDYIYMLTRRGQGNSTVPVAVYSIYRNAFNFFRMGDASAQAIQLALLVGIFMLIMFWWERHYVVYE